jgi:adenine-specific DNA-methyltransferase
MAKKTTKKKRTKKPVAKKKVESLKHTDASRKNIPTAEFQSVMSKDDQALIQVALERRNRDLDPQLVWRGKDEQDWSDLVVQAPPLFIQEKVHPKVLIDDLRRRTEAAEIARKMAAGEGGEVHEQLDLFADFNGIPDEADKTDFYRTMPTGPTA